MFLHLLSANIGDPVGFRFVEGHLNPNPNTREPAHRLLQEAPADGSTCVSETLGLGIDLARCDTRIMGHPSLNDPALHARNPHDPARVPR
ncbi:hypothetical protein ACFW93_37335 [Streptomyces canus]|uniref:hypothetical protein n=1 Tax=Streptomyces canus TaxID=58343 RepID=UPI00367561D3